MALSHDIELLKLLDCVIRNANDAHGVGVAGTCTPTCHNDDGRTCHKEAESPSDFHCKINAQVHVFGPLIDSVVLKQ